MENKPDTGLSTPRIRNRSEFLMATHNMHMSQVMAVKINLELFKGMDPKEVVANIPVEVPGSQTPTIKQITVKEEIPNSELKLKNIGMLLTAVEKLLKDEGVELTDEQKFKE